MGRDDRVHFKRWQRLLAGAVLAALGAYGLWQVWRGVNYWRWTRQVHDVLVVSTACARARDWKAGYGSWPTLVELEGLTFPVGIEDRYGNPIEFDVGMLDGEEVPICIALGRDGKRDTSILDHPKDRWPLDVAGEWDADIVMFGRRMVTSPGP